MGKKGRCSKGLKIDIKKLVRRQCLKEMLVG